MKSIKNLFSPYMGLPKEVYVIFLSRIVNAMGCFVMPLLTIILTRNIGMSEQKAGLFISLSGFLYMPASVIGGKLADTIGRKILIVAFDSIGIALYMVCGFIPLSMNTVYVLMLAGASMSMAGPAHDSLIADLTTPENRGGAYALTYMGWNIGYAVGPMVGGMLYKNHLPLVFIGDALTALLSLALITIFIKETIGLTKEDIKDESRKLEEREEGSIFMVLSKRPILVYFALIVFGYNFVYSQWSFMMPMHSMKNFGDPGAGYFGMMASFNGLIVMFLTPLITKLFQHVKEIRRMVYGGILYALGFGMLGLVNALPFFFMSVFIFTLGEIVLSISISPFIANHTPASHRGRMSAVLPTILGMGYTLGPLVMGRALGFITIETGWIALGLFVGISSVLMYRLEKYDARKKAECGSIEYAEV